MNPCYFRVKLDGCEALDRLVVWSGMSIKERIAADYSQAIPVSLDSDGAWKGSCLYVYENGGWTIFEDLSNRFSFIDVEDWKHFARDNSLVVASYDDALMCAELVVLEDGIARKNLVIIEDVTDEDVNEATDLEDICDWTDVASFIDNDELVYSDNGTVIIL